MQHVITPLPGFTFGCDPELFVLDQNGRPVSAEGMIPGTKSEPFKVQKGAVQVDGMAAEFNIDPAYTFEEFNSNILTVMKELKTFIPKGHTLAAIPSVVFDEEEWKKASDLSKELGCTPDFNAWTGGVNTPPEPEVGSRLRCAGGHLHVGWTKDEDFSNIQHIMNCRDLVRQFDWYLGAWSLKIDKDRDRRLLYGKAGSCRYKDYGVEYRTLSNFWVTSKDRRLAVWNRMCQAIHDIRYNFLPDKAARVSIESLIASIDSSERDLVLERQFRFPINSISPTY